MRPAPCSLPKEALPTNGRLLAVNGLFAVFGVRIQMDTIRRPMMKRERIEKLPVLGRWRHTGGRPLF